MIQAAKHEKVLVSIRVNGKLYEEAVEPRKLLSDFLREECGLTGTHVGCEHGVCGACTVRVNGAAVRSCLMFAVQAADAEITTVEGLAHPGNRHPLLDALSECHGLQCGFCTPGILMSAAEFLEEHEEPTREQIKEMLSGHLCRCTGYKGIVEAIEKVAKSKRTGR
ncbi:carbon-monoxide dehydrogenase small subunit/2-furoyl-CoA dehydrogenase 2Fe-2S iron sulfur subunit [Brevibacillus aydinogluensis]|jgi:aerobic-type carbon monoxide dehydrogenase small subunit (CoxS/CutS family)|uniref:(2Fe-2S)-binding protein n=1 Tax=Brevibacillus aydinogluensis TaxID=927786 RepID=UPI002892C1B3|nr:2Fe-2S iron-sulfur cluster-binding protein [Brevibacillus aydinogluensis]MDT3415046.1 carbon-monoxide dehydrogenase small subunit/2-furoyl-CoA dehydrogenase 2Fe-2S iron sulfur subunit [Brevibacillus aydinogluensis]